MVEFRYLEMKERIPKLLFFVLISFLVHIGGICIGAYYPTGTETFFLKVISGQLLDAPSKITNAFGVMTIVSGGLSLLYGFSKIIKWTDVYFFISSVIALSTFLYLINIIILRKYLYGKRYIWIRIAAIMFCLVWYYENIRLVEITRIALIHIVSVMMILLLDDEKKRGNGYYIFLILPCIFSIYYRYEALPFSLLLLIPVIICRFNKIVHKKSLVFLLISFVPLHYLFNYSDSPEDIEYKKFRAYQFSLFDYKDLDGVKLKKGQHAKALELAGHAYINDEYILDIIFSGEYIAKKDKSISNICEYYKSLKLAPEFLIKKSQNLDIAYFLYFINIVMTFVLSTWNRDALRKSAIYFFYVILFLFFVLLIMKLEKRIVLPAFIVIMMIGLYNNKDHRLSVEIFLFTSVLLMIPQLNANREIYKNMQTRYESFRSYKEVVKSLSKDKIVLIDLNYITDDGLKLSFFRPEDDFDIFSIDNGTLFFNDKYKIKAKRLWGTDKNHEILKKIADDESVLWAGRESRLDELLSFYKDVYHTNLGYVRMIKNDGDSTAHYNGFNVFQIKKLSGWDLKADHLLYPYR